MKLRLKPHGSAGLAGMAFWAVCQPCLAQTAPPASPATPAASSSATAASATTAPAAQPAKETHISPQQAKELFRSVDQIMQFASQDSGLKVKHEVKRQLTTRNEVEAYITDRFHEDKDTQRMERSEIVLKKFGLLDRDFHLQPFLVSLLKEQIAGYYDNKPRP